MDDRNRYRFVNVWHLKFRPEEVYLVLEDIGAYPRWWPEVRRVDRIDDSTVRIVARSVLPYDLTFQATDSRQGEQAGVLEVAMRGDLDGFSRWTLDPERAGTVATFEEEVTVRRKSLRRLAMVARPFFRWNHAVMMRHGRRGLGVYLAGRRGGAQQADELSRVDRRRTTDSSGSAFLLGLLLGRPGFLRSLLLLGQLLVRLLFPLLLLVFLRCRSGFGHNR
ncbi:MAG: SRPBCC family protein [Acidimicrobiia bacterium]|jgi:Polyketide cyclase / dehydrase and lipid transport